MHVIDTFQTLGWPGWLLFIGLYAASCLLFIPGSILTLAAGAVYGFWGGVALVILGNGLGAFLGLILTRYWLREWAMKYFSKNPQMMALEKAVEKEGWKIICLTHLSPIMPFSLINYAYGLTNISIVEFLVATELGSIPSTILYVYLGRLFGSLASFRSELRHPGWVEWLLQGLGLAVTIAVTIYLSRLASRALKKQMNR